MNEFDAPPLEAATLTTERLVLRRLGAADAPALFAVFSDPEVMRYWSSTAWDSMQQADDYVASADAGIASGSDLRLGIILADEGNNEGNNEEQARGTLIGQVALYRFDRQNRRCDVGYALGRAHWGHGYLGEALAAMLEHGFATLGLNRVEADVDPRNVASAKTLERLGFKLEGLMPERWIVGGEVCGTAFYGLLKSGWKARSR